LEAVGEAAAETQGKAVEIRFTRIHPRWHGAALLREERVASRDAQAFPRNISALDAVRGMKAVQETAAEDSVHAVEIVGGRAAGEICILIAGPKMVDERQ